MSSPSKSFFKVILCPTIDDPVLRIPNIFVKNYGEELSDSVRLVVPTGDISCVKLVKKSDKTIWLQDGFQKFIEDHSIKFGYVLLFDYQGNSIFKVRIYNVAAMEIQYPSSTTHDSATPNDMNQLPISDPKEDNEEDDDDCSIELLGSSTDHDQLLVSGFAAGTRVALAKRRKLNRCYLTRSKKKKIQDEEGITAINIDKINLSNGSMQKGIADETLLGSEFASTTKQNTSVASAKRRQLNRSYLTRSKKMRIQDEEGIKAIKIDKINQSNRSMQKQTADETFLLASRKDNRKITSSTNAKNTAKKCKSVGSTFSSKDYLDKRPAEVQENQATQAANMRLPKSSCYKRTMKAYNICKSDLVNLPCEFSKLYLSCTSKSIKLQDADDNEWEVFCNVNKSACQLTKGWSRFVRAKNLMVGDICFFEPFRINEEVKLKVNIRRIVDMYNN